MKICLPFLLVLLGKKTLADTDSHLESSGSGLSLHGVTSTHTIQTNTEPGITASPDIEHDMDRTFENGFEDEIQDKIYDEIYDTPAEENQMFRTITNISCSNDHECVENSVCDLPTNTCVCNFGWTGTKCEIRICSEDNDCGVNSFCDFLSKSCKCKPGWTGASCETELPAYGRTSARGAPTGQEWCNLACEHGACEADRNKQFCMCEKGWYGHLCEKECKDCTTNCIGYKINCNETGTAALCPVTCGLCEPNDILEKGSKSYGQDVLGEHYFPQYSNGTCTNEQDCGVANSFCDIPTKACMCNHGWAGTNCELRSCNNGQDCGANSICIIPGNTCECKAGWTGTYCESEIRNPGTLEISKGSCTNDPDCGENSVCDISTSTCMCNHGWGGTNCDIRICTNDQDCRGENSFCDIPNKACKCNPGWSGAYCQLNSCYNKCPINSVCIEKFGICKCYSGWTGPHCDKPDCPGCINGNCIGALHCECNDGYIGVNCDKKKCSIRSQNDCQNGYCNEDTQTCTCYYGFEGSKCDKPICPGGCNKGQCTSPGVCNCPAGFTGYNCETKLCSYDCNEWSTCDIATNFCICKPGWTGPECKTPICYGGCGPGICKAPYQCSCPNPYTGPNCANRKCTRHSDCGVNGVCNEFTHWCTCYPGYTGHKCDTKFECPGCVKGTCIAPGTCVCDAGIIGPFCNIRRCASNRECGNGVCHRGECKCNNGYGGNDCTEPLCHGGCNGGSCISPGKCQCPSNYSGRNCEIKDCRAGCVNSNCNELTQTCDCKPGWTGPDCYAAQLQYEATERDEGCGAGLCTSPDFCSCPPTHTGPNCSTRKCGQGIECGNKSVCNRYINTCKCEFGLTGPNCERPLCPGGCDQGICINFGQCSCNNGFIGPKCDKRLCSEGCWNGYCNEATGACECNTGWSGFDCNKPVCPMGCGAGHCLAPSKCICHPDYTGPQCDKRKCESGGSECSSNSNCNGKTCVCNNGWSGIYCDKPNCPAGCGAGRCVSPRTCECPPGYAEPDCKRRICSATCNEHSSCDQYGNTCQCMEGWTGPDCDTPICPGGCGAGICESPNICKCPDGYTGDRCEARQCFYGCWNGNCETNSNTCGCNKGWTGSHCSKPICEPGCGSGDCVKPNTCLCPPGITGEYCDINCMEEHPDCKPGKCNGEWKRRCPSTCGMCGQVNSDCCLELGETKKELNALHQNMTMLEQRSNSQNSQNSQYSQNTFVITSKPQNFWMEN